MRSCHVWNKKEPRLSFDKLSNRLFDRIPSTRISGNPHMCVDAVVLVNTYVIWRWWPLSLWIHIMFVNDGRCPYEFLCCLTMMAVFLMNSYAVWRWWPISVCINVLVDDDGRFPQLSALNRLRTTQHQPRKQQHHIVSCVVRHKQKQELQVVVFCLAPTINSPLKYMGKQ